jgi:hypothetical protein
MMRLKVGSSVCAACAGWTMIRCCVQSPAIERSEGRRYNIDNFEIENDDT